MAYLLDANVFIQAKNLYYGFDFCPAFWDWLLINNKQQKVFSIEKVGNEIEAGNDELAQWVNSRGPNFFLKPDSVMLSALEKVSEWATSQNYDPAAVNTFFQVADYFLVAFALAHEYVIVTQEVASPSTKRIKIPNACIGLGIKCVTPYEMLRKEGARFILDTQNKENNQMSLI